MDKGSVFSTKVWLSDWAIISYIALLNLALHLAVIQNYGYFRDELYYIACSNHLAAGYVDQPALSLVLLRLVRLVFGDSLPAIRFLPALGNALLVLFTGLMAKELGGKKFAMILASLAGFATTGNFSTFHIYSMNFIDVLLWQACIFIIIRLLKTGNPKYWIPFGLAAGLGLENKISILFLGFGVAVGLLLTKNRKYLKSAYLWLGGGIAAALFLPYLLWNAAHGWPALEFMHNAETQKNIAVTALGFFRDQVGYNNPLTLLVWLPGLWYLFFHREGKKFRVFGWMYIALYALFTIQHGKDYYLAPAYPILFAGGAVLWENWLQPKSRFWLESLLAGAIFFAALIFCPLTLPVLPVEKVAALFPRLGINHSQERLRLGVLPQHFADMFGWEELVATVAKVYQSLTPQEQAKGMIYVRNYGKAGAIDFFGKKYGLPKATCSHNSYWFWGPPQWNGDVAIIFGTSNDVQASLNDLSSFFQEVTYAAATSCKYCMPYENNRPIFVCRGFRKGSFSDIWPSEKHFI
jgi:4-amino-4-deoxy-L-arabinose transferase-like glycosyltransferase